MGGSWQGNAIGGCGPSLPDRRVSRSRLTVASEELVMGARSNQQDELHRPVGEDCVVQQQL